MKVKTLFIACPRALLAITASLSYASDVGGKPFAVNVNGRNLYAQRCAMCHGMDLKGTGPLADRSDPHTPDLTTYAFKKRLNDYPGVIVSSIILRPNGDLIPRTLRENGVRLAPHSWNIQDLRDLNQYMTGRIKK